VAEGLSVTTDATMENEEYLTGTTFGGVLWPLPVIVW
jgi:hypothetical protein